MKKILALAVGMLLIPFTAFGMEAMSDGDMDSITGQSGVAISLSNIQLYSDTGGDELWYETGDVAVGLVNEEGSASYTFINSVGAPSALIGGGSGYHNVADGGTDANSLLRGNYDPLQEMATEGLTDQGLRQGGAVLSIRVAEHVAGGIFGEAGTTGAAAADTDGAYIEIGLPTAEIYSAAGSLNIMTIYVTGAYGANPVNNLDDDTQHSLGTIYTTDSGSTTTILGGKLGITSYDQITDDAKNATY